jgi:cytochrome c5
MNAKHTAAAFAAVLFLACGTAFAADPVQGSAKALFESKCSICHPVSRPLGKTKDKAGWTATVTRMKNVNGCPITDEEAGVIIDYLTKIRGPVAR